MAPAHPRNPPLKGRGALSNPAGRFERHRREAVDDGWYRAEVPDFIPTSIEPDRARSVIARNDSPDIPFEQSINPYRGCSHGCVWCYARPSHSYVGLSPGLDFETRLFYKKDAGRVLEEELARPGYVCKPITLGANTDPYQPIERRMRVTREVLEVLARSRHPVTIITKGALVLRDLDLLADLAKDGLAGVGVGLFGSAFRIEGIQPVVAWYSVGLAFGISVAVGLFFGLYPASRAAALPPAVALRRD